MTAGTRALQDAWRPGAELRGRVETIGSPTGKSGKRTGRGADELGDGVALHELGHVEAHHCLLAAKVVAGQRLCQLRLADTGGACAIAEDL